MPGALDSADEVIGGKNEDVGNGVVIKNRFGRHVVFSPFSALCVTLRSASTSLFHPRSQPPDVMAGNIRGEVNAPVIFDWVIANAICGLVKDPSSDARNRYADTDTGSGGAVHGHCGGRQGLIVDFGPGVVRRAAAASTEYGGSIDALNVEDLEIAFLTHLHHDHSAGLPDLVYTS